MANGDDFRELVRDPKTGKLREGTITEKVITRPKSRLERLGDILTEPYAGTQGQGKDWAKDMQREKESPVKEISRKKEIKVKERGNGRQPKERGDYTK